ncbi:hypothetical protein WJX81_004653 [Elliptochloris bilobata]|uniref:Uncharacterized protein n=1 Tax=Elliptochloris bilobata TaxID=381761 RepID=A0AAW1S927_9CHLO
MAQKPLFKKAQKAKSKPAAANRHGKVLKVKKGKVFKAPKMEAAKAAFNDAKELTTAINARNESRAAGLAEQNGGRLAVLRAPPPVAAAGNDKRKGRGALAPKPK